MAVSPYPPNPNAPNQPGKFRVLPSRSGPIVINSEMSDQDVEGYVAAYDSYISDLEDMYAESAGFEREKLAAQINDAKKARDNALAIAQLSAETSRYGTDVGRQTALDQLKENARQFDARHALDEREFGLKYATTMTEFLSGPDSLFQARQFGRSMNAITAGPTGVAPGYRAGGDVEQPRTAEQFAALANPGSGGGGGGAVAPATAQASGGGGGAADPRLKAANAIAQALPPSRSGGYSARDFAALRAMGELYAAPLEDPDMDEADRAGSVLLSRGPGSLGLGQLESLAPTDLKALGSLARTKGIDPSNWLSAYKKSRPGQVSALRG